MELNPDDIRAAIRAKVLELAANLGEDASELDDNEIIPASGFVDSAAILELVVWYEDEYDLPLEQSEINICHKVLYCSHRICDASGGIKFHTMALTVTEREGVRFKAFRSGNC